MRCIRPSKIAAVPDELSVHKLAVTMFAILWDGNEYIETIHTAFRDTRVECAAELARPECCDRDAGWVDS